MAEGLLAAKLNKIPQIFAALSAFEKKEELTNALRKVGPEKERRRVLEAAAASYRIKQQEDAAKRRADALVAAAAALVKAKGIKRMETVAALDAGLAVCSAEAAASALATVTAAQAGKTAALARVTPAFDNAAALKAAEIRVAVEEAKGAAAVHRAKQNFLIEQIFHYNHIWKDWPEGKGEKLKKNCDWVQTGNVHAHTS